MGHLDKTLKILESSVKMVQQLDELLKDVKDHRKLTSEQFTQVGREMIKYGGLFKYLTSHTPLKHASFHDQPELMEKSSYRLWIGKPEISKSGHPDWDDTAVAEMWIHTDDNKVYEAITTIKLTSLQYHWDIDIVRTPNSYFCRESRIYRIY